LKNLNFISVETQKKRVTIKFQLNLVKIDKKNT